jgi:hypothetical protein
MRWRKRETVAGDSGRNETADERSDRNFAELLQELRVAQTGVQILFAFLLTLPFTERFVALDRVQETLYGVTVASAALAMTFLVAPVAVHRFTFRMQGKELVLRLSHRMTLVGLFFMGLAMLGAVSLAIWVALGATESLAALVLISAAVVTCWILLPMRVRRKAGAGPKEGARR